MTEAEKVAMVKELSGEEDEITVSNYLAIAGHKVCRKAYPFSPSFLAVTEQYAHIQVEIAVYLLNRRGSEGQVAHSENGISRSYESADVPDSMMRDIIPNCSALGV